MTLTTDAQARLIEERGWFIETAGPFVAGLGQSHWRAMLRDGTTVLAHEQGGTLLEAVTQAIRKAERATRGGSNG